MDIGVIQKKLEKELDNKRFIHSLNVMKTAVAMAEKYGADIEKARLAGILHDCGKNYKGKEAIEFVTKIGYKPDEIEWLQPGLLHGVIGEYIAKYEYKVLDPEVLGAIRWHTTGRANMTLLEKIIYIADYIEPLRNFEGIEEMRRIAFEDLDRCIILCSDSTIRYILMKGALIHYKSIEARNFALYQILRNKSN